MGAETGSLWSEGALTHLPLEALIFFLTEEVDVYLKMKGRGVGREV